MRRPNHFYTGYAFDLDGTVYIGDALLPGASEVLPLMKQIGRVVYVTNKPLESPHRYASKLSALGIPTETRDVVSSTDALLAYLAAHSSAPRLFVVGEDSLVAILESAGHRIVNEPSKVDIVVVSFDRTFNYSKLQIAFDAVRAGARIVATNPDAYCPTPDGGLPDCAAMLAALEACTGVGAEAVVGKPSTHMAEALLGRLSLSADRVLMVGDRLSTDIRMAREAGMASALVLTGATKLEEIDRSEVKPDFVLDSLFELLPPDMTVRPSVAAHNIRRTDG